jgi:hypothetical protein
MAWPGSSACDPRALRALSWADERASVGGCCHTKQPQTAHETQLTVRRQAGCAASIHSRAAGTCSDDSDSRQHQGRRPPSPRCGGIGDRAPGRSPIRNGDGDGPTLLGAGHRATVIVGTSLCWCLPKAELGGPAMSSQERKHGVDHPGVRDGPRVVDVIEDLAHSSGHARQRLGRNVPSRAHMRTAANARIRHARGTRSSAQYRTIWRSVDKAGRVCGLPPARPPARPQAGQPVRPSRKTKEG